MRTLSYQMLPVRRNRIYSISSNDKTGGDSMLQRTQTMKTTLWFAVVLAALTIVVGACAPVGGVKLTPAPGTNSTAVANNTAAPTVAANSTPVPTAAGPGQVEARLGEPVTLHVGQTALVADSPDQFGITFRRVKQDSRCPQGVVCIWAGEVRVEITFQESGVLHPPILELTTTPGDAQHRITVENYQVELVEVQPPRIADKAIAAEEYAASFRITRTATGGGATAALEQPFTLKMFTRVEIPEAQLRVTLNGVPEESRCPKSVTCAVAGRAIVSFMVERNDHIGFFGLSTQPPDGRTRGFFEGYAVELVNVEPYPDAPDQKIPTTDYSATLVVHQVSPPTTVKKNEGFVLKVGQAVPIEGENAVVKFVRVQNDSRCPYPASCVVRGNAVVEATLTQADGTIQTFILNEDPKVANQRIPDTGLYVMELAALAPYPRADVPTQQIPQEEYEATFVVRKFASPPPPGSTKTPTASQPTTCLGLTQKDAEAILGQSVKPLPEAKVRMSANPFDDESAETEGGICAFVSEEIALVEIQRPGEPMLHASDLSFYGIGAARLKGLETMELLRAANILRGAKPDGDVTPYLLLKTRLAAGDWEGLLKSFEELPQGAPDVHVEKEDRFGEEGLWIWRAADLENYAALVVREKDSFVLVEALVNKKITEAAAKESMLAAAGKLFS